MTTKKKAMAAVAAGLLGLAALRGCGGPPDDLEVKGLRLGVPAEEAARAMLGQGFEIGGKAASGSSNWASREYKEAAIGHVAAHVRKVCAERGFADFGSYVKYAAAECGASPEAPEARLWGLFTEEEHALYERELIAPMARYVRSEAERLGVRTLSEYVERVAAPEEYRANAGYIKSNFSHYIAAEGELEQGLVKWINKGSDYAYVPLLPDGEETPQILDVLAKQAPDGTLSLAKLEELLGRSNNPSRLEPPIYDPSNLSEEERLGTIELLPEAERFPDIDAWVAEHYPGGKPYHLGGPWDGKAELALEEGIETPYVFRAGTWALSLDEQRRVVGIEFSTAAVDKLFGAEDMGAEEFAASFARAYDVPLEFYAKAVPPEIIELVGTGVNTGWVCVNRDGGWAVTINQRKLLEIKAITPASKQSFD